MTAISAEVIRLFEELRVPLLRYLYSMGVPLRDGEDVVQEAFLALHRHLVDGKPRHNLPGWLFRVARNLGLKQLAAGRAHIDTGTPDLICPALDPERRALMESRIRRLESVIAALPEQDRQCLFLRAEGLRYREIAQALDMSLGAVAQSISRALDRIARAEAGCSTAASAS